MTFFDEALTTQVTAEARETHFWRTVLTAIAGLLYALGWLTYKLFAGVWFVMAWCGAAVKIGWREAHSHDQKQIQKPSRPL